MPLLSRVLYCVAFAVSAAVLATGCEDAATGLSQSRGAPQVRGEALQLIKLNATSSNALRRVQALEALVDTVGPEGVSFYNDALNDPTAPVRFAACIAIGQTRCRDSLGLVRIRAADADATVRAAAIYAMHRLGDTSRTAELAGMLFHSNPRVRAQVCTVLGLLGEKGSIPLVRRGLQDEDIQVQWAAMEALGRLGDKNILNQLMNFSTVGYADDRILAILALGEVRYGKAISILEGQLAGDYQEVRLASARALGMLGRQDGVNEVKMGLQTKTDLVPKQTMTRDEVAQYNSAVRVRSMAAMAAGAIGERVLLPDLQARMTTDPDMQVRLAAAAAIVLIIDRGPQKGPAAYDTDVTLVPAVAPTPNAGVLFQQNPQGGQDFGGSPDRRVTNPQPAQNAQPGGAGGR